MKKVFKILFVILLLTNITYADPSFTKEEMDWMEKHPVIYYAPDQNFPPFEFNPDGKGAQGIASDYVELIEGMTGLTFKTLEYQVWGDAFERFQMEKVDNDIVIDVMVAAKSEEREKYLIFSNFFIEVPSVIVVKQGNRQIDNMESLNGLRVSTVKSWITNDFIKENYPAIQIVNYDDITQTLNAVALGEVDATIANLATVTYEIQKSRVSNLKVLGNTGQVYRLSFAMRKSQTELLSIINKSIAQISDNQRREIENKWIGIETQKFYDTNVFRIITSVFVGLIIILWLWVVLLRKEVAKRTSALTKNKNMLNRIIDHVPHFIFVKNYDGVFVLVNKAMADYYDKKISVMVGKKLSEVLGDVSEDDSDFYLSRDREVITTNRDMIIPEETFRNNKGDLEIFRVHKTSIHIDGEEKPCALTIAVNMMEEISAKKELQVNQDALLRAELQLAESEKKATLGSMVGGITHEINNPIGISVTALSHIRFEHDIFKEKFENEKLSKEDLVNYIEGQDEGIRILQINIDRAVEMIQSFKMMSNDQLSEAKANFDLCDTINHVITSLHHQVKRKGHTITFVSECPIFITSYSGSYSQVFTNLILNSVVHGFENKSSGSIEIKVTREQDKIIMIYKDDGIGMTPEHLSKVFQPYFTTKRSQGGSGLGMQIIYNIIVRTLHGTINFDSKINEGVICTMKIPFNVSE